MTEEKATIQLLENINKNLTQLNERMQSFEDRQADSLQRLVVLEERSSNTSRLEDRIDKVEEALTNRANNHSDRLTKVEALGHRLDGATSVVEWANKLWPLFAAVIGLVGVYMGFMAK
ncbi:hypothetical protein [Alterisphingorhabdus coralli]|uniref:Uncharacterized protein n=1 Tax=Alterisphingorhabdus coralli TaxID=3071408 RepID=A0AA97F8E1_9SPHN|nr:hypothetical protein [Parasphingorhabdus sp. SCSIO 66989]WOE76334.1 hypothetical protein RB602_06375 [Parasphingorhabdus sp. SCSIO 66989]